MRRAVDVGLLGLIVFPPLAFGAVEEWAIATTQLVAIAVVGLWAIDRARRPRGERRPLADGGLRWPALLLAAIVVLQLVPLPLAWIERVSPATAEAIALGWPDGVHDLADLPERLAPGSGAAVDLPARAFDVELPSARPLSLTPAYTLRALQLLVTHLLLFFVALDRFADGRFRERFLIVLGSLAGAIALVGILQQVSSAGVLYGVREAGSGGSFGPFVSRNNFAGWMEMALGPTAGLAALAWHRRRRVLAAAMAASAGFGAAAFVFSQSRGGALALTAATIAYLVRAAVLAPRRRAMVLVPLALALVAIPAALYVGGPDVRQRYETLAELDEEASFRFRWRTTLATLDMAREFPLAGTGLGTFEEAYYLRTEGTSARRLIRAHNDYAQVVAECGWGAAIAVVWALWLLVGRGLRPATRGPDRPGRWPLHGACVGVGAMLVHSAVDFNLQILSNGLLFVVLCAFVLARTQSVESDRRTSYTPPGSETG